MDSTLDAACSSDEPNFHKAVAARAAKYVCVSLIGDIEECDVG